MYRDLGKEESDCRLHLRGPLVILLQFNGVHFAESENSLSNRISTTLGILEQILYASRDPGMGIGRAGQGEASALT